MTLTLKIIFFNYISVNILFNSAGKLIYFKYLFILSRLGDIFLYNYIKFEMGTLFVLVSIFVNKTELDYLQN